MKKVSVIVADDHPIFRDGLYNLLHKMACVSKIRLAANGKEVLALLENEKSEIVFMDMRMPVMDGMEATALLKKKFESVHVIALTITDDRSRVAQIFRNGASGYLFKHSDEREIEEAITAVMKGEKFYGRGVHEILIGEMGAKNNHPRSGSFNIELTEREREIIKLICHSYSNKEISLHLNIAVKTVETHRLNIYTKLNIKKSVDLIYYAIDNGIVNETGL